MLEKVVPKLECDAEMGGESWSSEVLVFIPNSKGKLLF